ncbi:MAG: 4-hydroxybenzoate octaprenyltransferase, partial [Bacteroidetes bacterium]
AMVDRDDDLKIGVKSTAILFGQQDRLIIGLLQLAMFLLLIWAGMLAGLGYVYFTGLALAALLAGYQQWLIRRRERDGCFRAFLNNHPLGLVVFLGLFFDYALI